MRPGVAPRGVVPEEKWLCSLYRPLNEIAGTLHQLRIDVFHADLGRSIHARMRREWALICDLLFANTAPARVFRRIINVGRNAADDVARTEHRAELLVLGVLRIVGFFQRIKVVEDSVELVKTVDCGQILIAIPQVILANLRGRVAERLENLRDCWIGILQALLSGWQTDFQQPRAEWSLPGDEC